MQQLAESAPSPSSSSFAGLLAALTAPAAAKPDRAWDDDGLADDVATLSYEHALRSHARYRPSNPPDWPFAPSAAPELAQTHTELSGLEPAPSDRGIAPQTARANAESSPAPAGHVVNGRNLLSSSITIRLSQAEGAQLRHRAADAGLTISAYLRSCTFEAESLRAQVKEALAQLRSTPVAATPPPPARARFAWLRRLLSW
ncbi:MAG: plasmid mobilization protein [Terracidiphilus sp.]